jgi:hypothetical protein
MDEVGMEDEMPVASKMAVVQLPAHCVSSGKRSDSMVDGNHPYAAWGLYAIGFTFRRGSAAYMVVRSPSRPMVNAVDIVRM